ncbi:hypothetical protein MTF65_20655 [Streptomyces sp. APSN-46.1]|uniref:hypothetical protein n=1 Tax=Streptomyces sp. APSN-46.1 TaxID=2929049 RepID=UPI001FB546C6|nr:hypothetical protein [Streptomyces sp. APSN-46.1]MCJ1679708.1 hypothetical protein [Streptomyces sp. APSN-46.1]
MASPLTFALSMLIGVQSRDRDPLWEGVTRVLLWAGMGGVVVAPSVGLVVALIGRRRRARRRFALMGAASLTACVILLVFWKLALEVWWRDVENLEEMRQLRAVIQNHPVLASRVDTMVGTHFSGRRRELAELVRSLVHDLVMANGSWDFEQETFDAAYRRLEAVLAAGTVTFTDFAPLLGFDGDQSVEGQQITAGVVLRRMTDIEISLAVQRAAIPIDQYMTTTMMLVSRFNQWALTVEHTHPLQTGDTDLTTPPAAPPLPTYADEIPAVLAAIRLICGGSTTTSYGIRTDSLGQGYSAALTPIGPTDPSRPTVLAGQETLDRVRTTYQHLTHPAVIADRPLSTATRQVVLAGSRGLVQDRILNLVTAGEALFIKRPGHSGPQKARPLASGAAGKLTGDPALGTPTRANIEALILAVYQWRNTEVHGDQHRTAPLRRLDGSATRDLAAVAEDLDRMMRRALLLALEDASQAPGCP